MTVGIFFLMYFLLSYSLVVTVAMYRKQLMKLALTAMEAAKKLTSKKKGISLDDSEYYHSESETLKNEILELKDKNDNLIRYNLQLKSRVDFYKNKYKEALQNQK